MNATAAAGTAGPFRRALIAVGLALVLPFIAYETLLLSGAIPPLGQEQGGAIVERLIFYAFVGGVITIVGGFALAFFVAKRDTIDADQIIRDLKAATEAAATSQSKLDAITRLTELQDSNALRDAVVALLGRSGEPDDRPRDRPVAARRYRGSGDRSFGDPRPALAGPRCSTQVGGGGDGGSGRSREESRRDRLPQQHRQSDRSLSDRDGTRSQ